MTRTATLLAVLTLLIGACGTSTPADAVAFVDSDGRPQETVELTVWTWEASIEEAMIRDFERQNPHIEVTVRYSSFDQHHTGLRSALDAEGDVPDIAMIERDYIPSFLAQPEQFTDLRLLGSSEVAADYLDWRWAEGVTTGGEVIGVPTDVGGLAFAYRRDLFQQAGLPNDPDEVSELFATWEGFIEAGNRFADELPATYFVDSVESIYHARFGQGPVGYVDDDGNYVFDTSDALQDAWRLSVAAIDGNLNAPLTQFSPEWSDAMANDGFAVVASPSWMRVYIESRTPETTGRWGLAVAPGTSGNWGGSQITIPAGAEHPAEAWLLTRFLTDVEGQERLFELSGNFPSTPALFEDETLSGLADPFFDGQVVGQLYIDSLLSVEPRPSAFHEREVDRAFIMALQTYDAGDSTTPEQAWLRATIEIEQLGSAVP